MDDLTTLNDEGNFEKWHREIYPSSLNLKKVNNDITHAEVLDLDIKIVDRRFVTTLFKKKIDLNFKVNVGPDVLSCIHINTKYNFLFSGLFRLKSICSETEDFISGCQRLTEELLCKGYERQKIKDKFKRFFKKFPSDVVTSDRIWHFLHNYTAPETANLTM